MLKPFATKLDEEVLRKLDELAQRTQIPKSRLCRQAIDLLAEYYEEREKKLALAEQTVHEDSKLITSGTHKESSGKRF